MKLLVTISSSYIGVYLIIRLFLTVPNWLNKDFEFNSLNVAIIFFSILFCAYSLYHILRSFIEKLSKYRVLKYLSLLISLGFVILISFSLFAYLSNTELMFIVFNSLFLFSIIFVEVYYWKWHIKR